MPPKNSGSKASLKGWVKSSVEVKISEEAMEITVNTVVMKDQKQENAVFFLGVNNLNLLVGR